MSETATEQNVTTDDDCPRGPGTVNLWRYCAVEDGKYTMTRPWVKGGWEFATDGRMLVRVPTTKPDTDAGDRRPPSCLDLDWSGAEAPESELLPWPAAAYEFGPVEHDKFDDDDEYEDSLITFEPIPDSPIDVGKQKVAPRFHYLVSLLPNVRFYDATLKPDHMVYFRFDGGEGLVCGVRITPA